MATEYVPITHGRWVPIIVSLGQTWKWIRVEIEVRDYHAFSLGIATQLDGLLVQFGLRLRW